MKRALKKWVSKLHLNVTGVEPPSGFLASLSTLVGILGVGTWFYVTYEGWSLVDSFYFTVITIATVGYGDLHPTSDVSKLFTVFLIFMGVGLGLYVISSVAESLQKGREKRQEKLSVLVEKLLEEE